MSMYITFAVLTSHILTIMMRFFYIHKSMQE